MTDPWCWYINANIDWGFFVDGIHGTPYIAALKWIRHGIAQGSNLVNSPYQLSDY